MAKIEVAKVPQPPITEVVLRLDHEEARLIKQLFGNINVKATVTRQLESHTMWKDNEEAIKVRELLWDIYYKLERI